MRAQKVLVAGSAAVGKTSLTRRMKFDSFENDYKSTIGVQLQELRVHIDGDDVQVVLWDTDGNFGEAIFDSVYAKGSAGALLVADVTRPETIANMLSLATTFSEQFPGRPSLCVINKVDLLEPSEEMLARIKEETDEIALCSAKLGQGVQEAVETLVQRIIHRSSY